VQSLYAEGRRVRDRIVACEVREANASHVLAIIDVVTTPQSRVIPERTPVQMTWGEAPNSLEDFYGYVHHHQALSPLEGQTGVGNVVRYVLIGTSLPMNQQRTRSWRGVSGSYLARAIAKEHGLRAVVNQSPRVYPYVAQSGNSDFSLLKQLATDVGFRLWVNGATLWFVDPEALLLTPKTRNVPAFSMVNRTGIADSLLGLEVVNGTMVDDGGVLSNMTAYGFDPRSKRFFKATSGSTDAYLQTVSQTAPVESLAEAATTLSASQAASRNWVTAKARVRGNASLRPGSLIRLGGSGVLPDYQGLWLVDSATHSVVLPDQNVVGANNYVTDLQLVRNSTSALTFKDALSLSPAVESTPCRLTDQGLWQASILEERYVG